MKIHIGKKIEEIARKKGVKHSWLSEKMNLNRRTLYDIYEKEDINTHQLRKFSEILEHDFFQYLTINTVSEPKTEYKKQNVVTIVLTDDVTESEKSEFQKFLEAFAESYFKNQKSKK